MDYLHYHFKNHKKPVLLFIHGFLGSMNQWNYLEGELTTQFSVLKIDLPGHGSSLEFSQNYTLTDLVLIIEQILKIEKIDRVHIIGHSMGGYLGAAFAKERPQLTISLTMLNSIAGKDSRQRKLLRNRSIQLIEKHQEAYVSMAIANLFTADEQNVFKSRIKEMKDQANHISIKSIVQALECMRDRESSLETLKDSRMPISYIYGWKDHIILPNQIILERDFLEVEDKKIDSGHMSLVTNVADILKNLRFIE
ncbi:alpha/beta hydrolase [Nonlabens sp.]|jgi:2-succinyl-6-hydroxy-2,4-cyclohexadiene-1-carboxylate synthase|uniref:alpha/beta hydrolase n=1 Tax=Nonlabens sp. TaxID=1888209 RepID=UPI0039E538C7